MAPGQSLPIIRVMVVDESSTMRGLITGLLQEDEHINVVATTGDETGAKRHLKNYDIDLVILDLDNPVMDKIHDLSTFLEIAPHIEILVTSTLSQRDADISFKALQAGACDYVPKPEDPHDAKQRHLFKHDLLQKVLALGWRVQEKKKKLGLDEAESADFSFPDAPPLEECPKIIALGGGTGGTQAIFTLLSALKDKVKQPIVITQHMPGDTTHMLAQHITQHSGMRCFEAKEGMALEPGCAYVAPDDHHMGFIGKDERVIIKLNQEKPVNHMRPAIDMMIKSLGDIYPQHILAIMLTGMGSDGARACKKLYESGSTILAQDEKSSVIWGIPGAVAKAGICSAILPLETLAEDIIRRCQPHS